MTQPIQYTRLQPIGRLLFNRAAETFPKEEGDLDDSQEMFFSSILDEEDDIDAATVQNAINFARSFCELGKILKQSVLNKIFFASLKFQQFVPQLILFSNYYKTKSWIYNCVMHALTNHSQLFKDSIILEHPIWDFILKNFEEDFQEKIQMLRSEYSEHPAAFLFESIIFGWDIGRNVSISVEDIVQDIVSFLASKQSSKLTNSLLNYFCSIFPELVISGNPGIADRLSVPCLQTIFSLGLHTKYQLGTNLAILALKFITIDIQLAKSMIENCSEQEKQLFNEMLEHYDERQGRFIPE